MEVFPAPELLGNSKSAPTFKERVKHWTCATGGEILRSHESSQEAFPLQADLEASLALLVFGHGANWIVDGGDPVGAYLLHESEVQDIAANAAAHVLANHRPVRKRRFTTADAVTGGKASKRTSQLLEQWKARSVELENASISEVAKLLNCHPRTVSKLRRQLALESDPDYQQVKREEEALAMDAKATKIEATKASRRARRGAEGAPEVAGDEYALVLGLHAQLESSPTAPPQLQAQEQVVDFHHLLEGIPAP